MVKLRTTTACYSGSHELLNCVKPWSQVSTSRPQCMFECQQMHQDQAYLQVSLSALDRRIATLFVHWDVFNVFLGGMFAGSAFSQLGVIIAKPGSIPSVIGTALPASSNFFINTLILKVLEMCLHQYPDSQGAEACPHSAYRVATKSEVKAPPDHL